jgi:hypothetical protein
MADHQQGQISSSGSSSSASQRIGSHLQASEPAWIILNNYPNDVSKNEASDLLREYGDVQALKVLHGTQNVAFVRMSTVVQTDSLVAALSLLQTGTGSLEMMGRANAGMRPS